MSRRRSTEDLLAEFSQNPGAENEQLEFKSKEILQSTGGKKKVIRTIAAMANRSGGTMIIGVRRQEDGLFFQTFEEDNEFRQELTHIAQQYTSPPVQDLWELDFVECMGQVLRIDVEEARDRLIQVHHQGEFQVWIRDEDGMREMTTAEIDDFYQRKAARQEAARSDIVERSIHLDFRPQSVPKVDHEDLFSRRETVRTNNEYTAIFGYGFLYDYLEKSHTLRLRTTFPGRNGYANIPDVIEAAEKHLDARTNRSFGYTIRIADLQMLGRSLESLRHDLDRLESVVSRLRGASEGGWRYGPVIAGVIPVDYGFLWFELQQETETFTRSNLRIVLQDIPFDQSPFHSFYDEIGTSPPLYDHRHGLQFVTLQGSQVEPLQNPRVAQFTETELEGPLYVTTDNPFYGWLEGVGSSIENPLPEYLRKD